MSENDKIRPEPTSVHRRLDRLPLLTRCLAAILVDLCDGNGRIELLGRSVVDAIAQQGNAHPHELNRIGNDVQRLIDVGYLRLDSDALVVVEQEARKKPQPAAS